MLLNLFKNIPSGDLVQFEAKSTKTVPLIRISGLK